ncbi:MAG: response regulator transcription factor [Bryobacteraceae bacterium]
MNLETYHQSSVLFQERSQPIPERPPARIVIADGHPIVREGLKGIFHALSDLRVVGEAANSSELLALAANLQPEIVLMELGGATFDGLATLRLLRQVDQSIKVLLLTDSDDRTHYVDAMRLGCAGIVAKASPTNQILNGVRCVQRGEIWVDAATTAAVMQQMSSQHAPQPRTFAPKASKLHGLSKRELDVVRLLCQGLRNRDIAEALFISPQTVKIHLHSTFEKTGVSDRLELALFCVYHNLYQQSPEDPGTGRPRVQA